MTGWLTRHATALTEEDRAGLKDVSTRCPELDTAAGHGRDFGEQPQPRRTADRAVQHHGRSGSGPAGGRNGYGLQDPARSRRPSPVPEPSALGLLNERTTPTPAAPQRLSRLR
ncbi:hypothetical protein OG345_18855 [Streptomyces sp. NBC_01220]|uniref:hypothetical protein n=1 Tax=unclassified Streptomyces TaxID=2593676 RepID=UPI002E2C399C|nr:hypothetical protein [Streptomyces sp. NBC_00184]WSQ44923.1 hypothetical protein OG345_18855 [Streptomyces sp. NBC_01220]